MHAFSDPAFGANKSLPIHRWVPWIAGFSSAFAAEAIARRLDRPGGTVLDPFCGVGTTLVEAGRLGHTAVGFEINPWAALAARTKVSARAIHAGRLTREVARLRSFYRAALASGVPPRSRPPAGFRTRAPFFSPRVLHKTLVVRDFVDGIGEPSLRDLFRVALGATLVGFSNYSYEPSLGQRKSAGRPGVDDHPVGETLATKLEEMAEDLRALRLATRPPARVVEESFFRHEAHLAPGTVDLALTSPPYLNNYHYNRNTRPQLYWLGLVGAPGDLKPLEEANFGTYWQTARERERIDLAFPLPGSDLPERIERLRGINTDRGIYGGNGWANYAAAYFNDCHRFATGLVRVLRPGGTALVVVGNSILQGIAFPTDRHLAEIAAACGLEVSGIHVPRTTRVGSSIIQSAVRAGRARDADQLYEAVVELRKG